MTRILNILILFLSCLLSFVSAHVDIVYPSGGESFSAGSDITIQWQETASHGDSNWDLSFSTDNGATWQSIQNNINQGSSSYNWKLPDTATEQAKISVVQDNTTFMNYESISGAFTITSTTDIEEADDIIQKAFILNPAYPNPFNGSTTISFSLARNSNVKINIYSILGKNVEKLFDGQLNTGEQRIRWNPKNLPSGIYYYIIQSGLHLETKRLIYIK